MSNPFRIAQHLTIRPVATFDARGSLYEGWDAVTPEGKVIACSPEKEDLKAMLRILDPECVLTEEPTHVDAHG
jgi:hypothetical protein